VHIFSTNSRCGIVTHVIRVCDDRSVHHQFDNIWFDCVSLLVVSCVNSLLVEVAVRLDFVFHRSRWPFVRRMASGAASVERKQDLEMASSAGFAYVVITCLYHSGLLTIPTKSIANNDTNTIR